MSRSLSTCCLILSVATLLAGCAPLSDQASQKDFGAGKTTSRAAAAQPPLEPVVAAPVGDGPPAAAGEGLRRNVVFGSDRFIKLASSGARGAVASGDGEVTLNFADADIRDVVRSVLGDILGLNYVIDPQVAGSVTVQTSRPVPKTALLTTLEALLRSSGAGLVRDGDLYRVVAGSGSDSARGSPPIRAGPAAGDPGFGVQVVPLSYVAADEMAEILELYAPQGSILAADKGRNLLILQGTREDRVALLDAVELFDVDWIEGMSFGLFPLSSANAESLVDELQTIFSEAGFGPSHELLRFIPIARLNAVIAISPRAFYLEQAQAWIQQLDRGTSGAGERLHIYFVENARAAELAEVLNQAFDRREQGGTRDATTPALLPAAYGAAAVEAGRDDTGANPPAGDAQSGRPVVPADRPRGIGLSGAGRVRIIAAESSNALLVLATPQDYRMVEQAIRRLDIIPLQVLIEATIAEVTLNDALRYGVQWFLDSGDNEFTLSELASGAAGQLFPGFSYLFKTGGDVRVVLNALSSVTDVEVVSSPQLMVLDNRTAELQVGDEVPIATQSAVSVTDPDAPIVNSIEFRDTGVILRVTPRVNPGGLVTMEIAQEVSSVVGTTTSGIDSPTIQQRKVTSSVAVQSGETVALGGLISERRERSSGGLPLLSEIPLLGAAFGSKADGAVRTELLVLITPRVVTNQRDAREVTEELRSRMRAVRPLSRKVE